MKKNLSKQKWHKTIITLAAVITIAGTKGFSSHAVIGDSITLRMESMLEKQKEAYLRDADAPVNALYTSREYTKTEKKRKAEMAAAYKKGIFPEGEITRVSDASQTDSDTLCYIRNSGRLHLPERELTDEELLQIIDYTTKLEYAITERSKKLDADEVNDYETMKQEFITNGGLSEEEAIAIADEWRSRVWGETDKTFTGDLKQILISRGQEDALLDGDTELSYDITLVEPYDGCPYYSYCINYGTSNRGLYSFEINAEDGTLEQISVNFDFEEADASVAEQNIPAIYEKAKEDLRILFGITEDYEEIYCSYTKDDHEEVDWNEIHFFFLNKDGTGDYIMYDCVAMEFSCYCETTRERFEEYMADCEYNERMSQDTTVTKKLK